jgi:ABC-2 type transport system permease protein
MRILDLMLKDLRQIVRDRRMAAFVLIMPVVFTVLMGFVQSAPEPGDPRLPVGLVVADDGLLGQRLAGLVETSSAVRPVPLDGAPAAEEQVRAGDLAAALVVPAGFTQALEAGQAPRLTLIADTTTPAGQSARQSVQGLVMRLLSSGQAANLTVGALEARQPFGSPAERSAAWATAAEQALNRWQASGLGVQMEAAAGLDEQPQTPSSYAQSSPGMLVMFAIFGLLTSAALLPQERKTRTLQRLLTTSMSRAEIIGGHALAMFVMVFAQGLILIALGQAVLGVNYLAAPAGTLLVLAALAVWVASLGLFLGAVARGEEQVLVFAMIAMFVFSALGGAWFPLEGTGGAFAFIGRLMPSAWAMTGFQNIIVRGLDTASTLVPAGILLAYAAGFFALAVWRFRFDE